MAPQPVQGGWSTGLCDCCAEPSGFCWCCYAYWCTCCAYGNVVELMDPSFMCGGSCIGGFGAYTGMYLLGFPCLLQMMSRNHTRLKYGIAGDPFADFCISWCCAACAICQEYRELTIRGHTPGGGAPFSQPAVAMAPMDQQMQGMNHQMQAVLHPPPPAPYPGQPPAPYPPGPYPPAPYPPTAQYAAQPGGVYPPMPYPPAAGVPAAGYQPGYEQAPPHKV